MNKREGAEPRIIVEARKIVLTREREIRYHEVVAVGIYHQSPELPEFKGFVERRMNKLRKVFVDKRKADIRRRMAEFEKIYPG